MHALNRHHLLAIVLSASAVNVLAQDATHAGEALKNAAMSSGHASASAAHSVAASGQVTSGVLAVPLLSGGAVLGSAGAVSTQAGLESLKAANAPIGTPLQITDEVITVVPPSEALKSKVKAPETKL